MASKILIVDDDPVQRRLLDATVSKLGYATALAEDGAEVIARFDGPQADKISLVILDLVMPGVDGFAVLEHLRRQQIHVPVIVQTAKGGIETVVTAMRAGAQDFVVKPISPQRLQVSIENCLSMGALKCEITRMKKTAAGSLSFAEILSASANMDKVKRLGAKAAQSNIPILIEGESGVGKELIARAIQGSGARAKASFVTVNCGALPENLVESILFGHEKGAFTGASDKHIGKFQDADKGTLFLDEIGELPALAQVKLLRALQEGEIDPVGGKKPVKTDFRLISATNRTLADEVADGNFREDLYYRISVFPIWVPPLRERREDIAVLARHFTAKFAAEEGCAHIKSISPQALAMLEQHDWPGNIRQLENAIFRAVVLCEGNELTVEDFPQMISRSGGLAVSQGQANPTQPSDAPDAASLVSPEPGAPVSPSTLPVQTSGVAWPDPSTVRHGATSLVDDEGQIKELHDLEEEVIRFAVELYNGKMSKVARKLGIGRSTLYRRLKELGIAETEEDRQTAIGG